MMNKKRRNRRAGVPLVAYLMLLTLVSTLMASTLMASTVIANYIVSGGADDGAQVAAVVLDGMTNSITYPVTGENIAPGEAMEVIFTVQNHRDGNEVSEVALKYNIVITDENNLPLNYTLAVEPIQSGTAVDVSEGEAITGGTMNPAEAVTHTYKLIATWVEDKNAFYLADEIDLITVTVNAEQID